MIPELETSQLRLRAWSENDLGPFTRFYADEKNAEFIGGMANRSDVWRRMACYVGHWWLRGYGLWALEMKNSEKFIGYAGLWFPEGWPEPEIGWGLLQEYRGHGYATEAAKRARQYAYDVLGWATAVSCIDKRNISSQRVAERLNAKYERDVEILGQIGGLYRHPAPNEPELLN